MMNWTARIAGLIRMFTSLTWAALSVLALILGIRLLDNVGRELTEAIDLGLNSLSVAGDSLALSQEMVYTATITLDDASEALIGASNAISLAHPTLETVNQILVSLDKLKLKIPIIGVELGLGVDYTQDARDKFDALINDMPEISQHALDVGNDLRTVRDTMPAVEQLLEQYSAIVQDATSSLQKARDAVPRSLLIGKCVLVGITALILVSQIPSFYLGWIWADMPSKRVRTDRM
jgi:hypothetical protein